MASKEGPRITKNVDLVMTEQNNIENGNGIVDIRALISSIRRHWRLFAGVMAMALALSLLISYSLPDYYECRVEVAPEFQTSASDMEAILAMVNSNLLQKKQTDAVYPLLYPDVVYSESFTANLFDVPVSTVDHSVNTTYYDYLKNHTRSPWWTRVVNGVKNLFKRKSVHDTDVAPLRKGDSMLRLSAEQMSMVNAIQGNMIFMVDKKSGLTTLIMRDQDPLVCATVADSVMTRLQRFITVYRTGRARQDSIDKSRIYLQAEKEFRDAERESGEFNSKYFDLTQPSLIAKRDELEKIAQMKYQIMADAQNKYQVAKAKVQERKPVFTAVQSVMVTAQSAGPHRGRIVFAFLLVAFLGCIAYVFRHRLGDLID